MTITEIKKTNKQAGRYWFERDTMRFFRSRAFPTVYGGRYFVSSEQFNDESPRLYTIREAVDGGREIEDVGEFQAYQTKAEAVAAIKQLLATQRRAARLTTPQEAPPCAT